MSDKPYKVKCRNKTVKERGGLRPSQYPKCGNCRFLLTRMAESWRDDLVCCTSPIEMKYGDEVEVIPKRVRRVGKGK